MARRRGTNYGAQADLENAVGGAARNLGGFNRAVAGASTGMQNFGNIIAGVLIGQAGLGAGGAARAAAGAVLNPAAAGPPGPPLTAGAVAGGLARGAGAAVAGGAAALVSMVASSAATSAIDAATSYYAGTAPSFGEALERNLYERVVAKIPPVGGAFEQQNRIIRQAEAATSSELGRRAFLGVKISPEVRARHFDMMRERASWQVTEEARIQSYATSGEVRRETQAGWRQDVGPVLVNRLDTLIEVLRYAALTTPHGPAAGLGLFR